SVVRAGRPYRRCGITVLREDHLRIRLRSFRLTLCIKLLYNNIRQVERSVAKSKPWWITLKRFSTSVGTPEQASCLFHTMLRRLAATPFP
ncbi:MAG: hypothetical protein WD038_01715, partial [Balneolales bacterium]